MKSSIFLSSHFVVSHMQLRSWVMKNKEELYNKNHIVNRAKSNLLEDLNCALGKTIQLFSPESGFWVLNQMRREFFALSNFIMHRKINLKHASVSLLHFWCQHVLHVVLFAFGYLIFHIEKYNLLILNETNQNFMILSFFWGNWVTSWTGNISIISLILIAFKQSANFRASINWQNL